MGPFASRQVILLPFPFFDLSKAERHAQVVEVVVDLVRGGV